MGAADLKDVRWTAAAVLAMAALFALSSVPDHGPGSPGARILFAPPALQNLLHVPVYAALAWLCWRALRERGFRGRGAAWAAAAIAVLYGAFDEAHQAFVPGRFASVTDALLNALGAAAAGAVLYVRQRGR